MRQAYNFTHVSTVIQRMAATQSTMMPPDNNKINQPAKLDYLVRSHWLLFIISLFRTNYTDMPDVTITHLMILKLKLISMT